MTLPMSVVEVTTQPERVRGKIGCFSPTFSIALLCRVTKSLSTMASLSRMSFSHQMKPDERKKHHCCSDADSKFKMSHERVNSTRDRAILEIRLEIEEEKRPGNNKPEPLHNPTASTRHI